jgi:hypothetical protein
MVHIHSTGIASRPGTVECGPIAEGLMAARGHLTIAVYQAHLIKGATFGVYR